MSVPGPSPRDPSPFGHRPSFAYAPATHGIFPGGPPPSDSGGSNAAGVTALVCGVLSLSMLCPLSIAAIAFGFVGMRKRGPQGAAIAGLVLGCVTLTAQVVCACFVAAFYGTVMAFAAQFGAFLAPFKDTQVALNLAATRVEERFAADGRYPTDEEGAALVADLKDGWGGAVAYRRDDRTEYQIRTAGMDGSLQTEDDFTYEPRYARISEPTARAVVHGQEIVGFRIDDEGRYPDESIGQAAIAHLRDGHDRALVYRRRDEGFSFTVASLGPDGQLDTPDDVSEIPESAFRDDPNERALYRAAELVEAAWYESESYPSDEAGAAKIGRIEDAWGNAVAYRRRQAGQSYAIVSAGPDGAFDTPDDLIHSNEDPYIADATRRALVRAVNRVEEASLEAEFYPSDEAGAALLAEIKDAWGNPIVYRRLDDGDSYRVFSAGPDGEPETRDDVSDDQETTLWDALAD